MTCEDDDKVIHVDSLGIGSRATASRPAVRTYGVTWPTDRGVSDVPSGARAI